MARGIRLDAAKEYIEAKLNDYRQLELIGAFSMIVGAASLSFTTIVGGIDFGVFLLIFGAALYVTFLRKKLALERKLLGQGRERQREERQPGHA
ncbi:MAG: hypothetical protein QW767_07090 [Thermoprotei archaeon]